MLPPPLPRACIPRRCSILLDELGGHFGAAPQEQDGPSAAAPATAPVPASAAAGARPPPASSGRGGLPPQALLPTSPLAMLAESRDGQQGQHARGRSAMAQLLTGSSSARDMFAEANGGAGSAGAGGGPSSGSGRAGDGGHGAGTSNGAGSSTDSSGSGGGARGGAPRETAGRGRPGGRVKGHIQGGAVQGNIITELKTPSALALLQDTCSDRVIGLPTTAVNARRVSCEGAPAAVHGTCDTRHAAWYACSTLLSPSLLPYAQAVWWPQAVW